MGDGAGDSSSRTDAGSSGSKATAAAKVTGDAVIAAATAQPHLEHATSSGAASALSHAVLSRAQTQLRQESLDRCRCPPSVLCYLCCKGTSVQHRSALGPTAPSHARNLNDKNAI